MRLLFILAIAMSLKAQTTTCLPAEPTNCWTVYGTSGVYELKVGAKLCRWYVIHAPTLNRVQTVCTPDNGATYPMNGYIFQSGLGSYPIGTSPSFPVSPATVVTGTAQTAVLFPLFSGTISWIVTAIQSSQMFRYDIVGWAIGGAENHQMGVF